MFKKINNAKKVGLLLLLLTLIGGLLRYYNINWDSGLTFHPDERNIDAAVSRIRFFTQMNPEFFAYGGLSIYLYRFTAEMVANALQDPSWTADWGKINIVGRAWAAFFSTLTIPLIFLLTKKVFERKNIALVASFLAAFTVGFIQIAHLAITENIFVLTSVLICYFSIKLYEEEKLKYFLKTGVLLGIAVAAKTTALSLGIYPAIAAGLLILKNINKPTSVIKTILHSTTLFLSGFTIFTLLSPYTFLSWGKFLESMRYESGVATGTLPVPYTIQFTNTIPYIFQINSFFWQIGPILYFSFVGIILMFSSSLNKKNWSKLIFLSFPVVYFIYVGSWHTKFIRFMLPVIPTLIITASFALFSIRQRYKTLGNILLAASLVMTSLWALSFFTIYTREQTRVTSSKWIYQNIPAGSKIYGEHWDDGLPVNLDPLRPERYTIEQLTIYDDDNNKKLNYYADKLEEGDYIVLATRRLHGTLMYLPEKYPLTSKYYNLLFAEKLGYIKVAEFSSYPNFLGFEINDDTSEETFQVYDHPKVIIFKNTHSLTENQLRSILGS